MLRCLLPLVATALVAHPASSAGAAELPSRDELELLFDAPALHSGDLETLREQWWSLSEGQPNGPAAQVAMLLWGRRFDDHPAPAIDADRWESLYQSCTTNGWTRRIIAWHWLDALRREGRESETSRLDITTGSPRRWLAIGPFGIVPGRAIHEPFPPEVLFEPEAEYPGSDERPVHWREVEIDANDTRLYPSSFITVSGAVVYLRSCFSVSEPVDAIVQIASSGSYRGWLDGEPVASVDRTTTYTRHVRRIPVHLEPGQHGMLFKCTGPDLAVLLRTVDGAMVPIVDGDPTATEFASSHSGSFEPHGLVVHDVRGLGVDGLLTRILRAYVASLDRDPVELQSALLGDLVDDAGDAFGPDGVDRWSAYAVAATELIDSIPYLPSEWTKTWLDDAWQRASAEGPSVPLLLARARERI
ncbi:MAG: hypothetical protein KDC38_07430, partial [Planctomycetes bacterium]|nr:hypothetical protein [Planctomycetota bacterium]